MRSVPASARLLTAALASCFGDGLQFAAFPLLGASLTGDPRIIAALAAVGTLPSLIGALPAGAIVDRVRRASLMVVSDLSRAAALAVFITVITTGRLAVWHLFVLAVLLGFGQLFFDISSAALIPELVPETDLPRFNGYLASIQELGNGLIGPACAGFLFALSRHLPFSVNAATFVISALILAPLVRREVKGGQPARMAGLCETW